MQQIAADELLAFQVHHLPAVAILVVLVAHLDLVILNAEDTAVADGDTMAVACQIVHHGFGVGEPGLGIDDPVGLHQAIEAGVDFSGVGDPVEFTGCGYGVVLQVYSTDRGHIFNRALGGYWVIFFELDRENRALKDIHISGYGFGGGL